MIEAVPQGTKRRKAVFAASAGKYFDSDDELVTNINILMMLMTYTVAYAFAFASTFGY